MDELVGEEPPDLLPLTGVVDQVGTRGWGQRTLVILAHDAGDVNTVPDVETDLIRQIFLLTQRHEFLVASEGLNTCLDDGETEYEDGRREPAVGWFIHQNLKC